MRSRNIKPGFFKNEVLAECVPLARVLFAGLWCYADREGRFEWRPKRIKAEILPYDDRDIEALLGELVDRGFVIKYSVNGESYGCIPQFPKHQSPHIKEKESCLPAPEQPDTNTVQAPEGHHTNPSDSGLLIPDSPIPDSITFSSNPVAFELANHLLNRILDWKPNFRKPTEVQFNKWTTAIDRMIRLDKRNPDQIRAVIDFATSDSFWQSNILSASSLRKHFDRLEGKMQQKHTARDSPGISKAKRERNAIMTFDQEQP
jgi:hypothetical protein